jgi:hypothetical protein
VVTPSERDMARGLRRYLKRAGVDRHELHHRTPPTRPIRFHDLRATGISWMAVRGDEPMKIQERAGHTDFETTQRYIRMAEALREGFGVVFPDLPPELFPEGQSHATIARAFVSDQILKQNQRGGRDSNPGENVASGRDLSPNVARPGEPEGSGSVIRRPVRPERGGASDDSEACEGEPLADCMGVVETAIAAALKLAAEAQQWGLVAQLAQELEARRERQGRLLAVLATSEERGALPGRGGG